MKLTYIRMLLRSGVFAIALVFSTVMLTAVLHNQVGKSIVGLSLLAYLLMSVVYATPRYLRFLWSLSGRLTACRSIEAAGPIPSSAVQEQGQ